MVVLQVHRGRYHALTRAVAEWLAAHGETKMLKRLRRILTRGLVAVLPVALTVYLLWWLATSMERLLHRVIVQFIPGDNYVPGMGIVAGLAIALIAGLMMNAWVVRRILQWQSSLFERIPVVKTIFTAIRDFVQLLPADGRARQLRRVVAAEFGGARLIGFVTRDDPGELGDAMEGRVPVYFPMSYQIGGYTLYLPRSALTQLDIPAETAMRLVLTGGLSGTPAK
jgi:uncharacterized membrane protein